MRFSDVYSWRIAVREQEHNYRGFVDSLATLKPESHANRSASPSPRLNGHPAGSPDVVLPVFMPASYAARRSGSAITAP
jgi:hypothetical protein